MKRIDAFEVKCFRWLFGASRTSKCTNQWVMGIRKIKESKQLSATAKEQKNRVFWTHNAQKWTQIMQSTATGIQKRNTRNWALNNIKNWTTS